MSALLIIQITVVILIILLVLIQQSSSDGAANLGGSNADAVPNQMNSNIILKVTSILGIIFILNSLAIARYTYISNKKSNSSIIERIDETSNRIQLESDIIYKESSES